MKSPLRLKTQINKVWDDLKKSKGILHHMKRSEKILVTGAAGFIGMHVAERLCERGNIVVGVDNVNDYYDQNLKRDRLNQLKRFDNFSLHQIDISDFSCLESVYRDERPEAVVHLAAQAGVRYSLENPSIYIKSNINGFFNVLECSKLHSISHLVYASSSSVYGANKKLPFNEGDMVDHPISLYAATKKSNEVIAHSYSHLYHLPTTGLRFFTVYGPWGRPDMAPHIFTKSILKGDVIDVYNNGTMTRDFTFIDDIVEGVIRVLDKPATPEQREKEGLVTSSTSIAPYRVFNIGNGSPTPLMSFIRELERALGVRAQINMLPLQPGDVLDTFSDTDELLRWVGYSASTPINLGLKKFADWYLGYYVDGSKELRKG